MSKPPKSPPPPKPPNPWDPLPIFAQGDKAADALFHAVGTALTAWELLDDTIGFLFGALVNSRSGSAEAAFGGVQSIEQQMRMVAAAAERIYPKFQNPQTKEMETPPLKEEIDRLLKDMGHLAGIRNNIAHGIVSSFESSNKDSAGKLTTTFHGCFLIPGHTNTKKHLKPEARIEVVKQHGFDAPPQFSYSYAYTAAQVLQYAEHFADYRKKAADIFIRVTEDLKQRWPPQALLELKYEQRIRELQTKLTALEQAQQPRPSEE